VSGWTIFNAERHSGHRRESPTQKRRSASFKDKRFFAERCRTPIWWCSATFSNWRAARLFIADETTTSIIAIQRRIKQPMECVQPSSSQPVRHLREPQSQMTYP
jgi:hypothetical protein